LDAGSASAQVLQAFDDSFPVPFGQTLVVEFFGVLDNDILDDEAAGELGATAELVTDVSHGTLVLGSDGSFTYSVGPTFEGSDQFVYRAVFGAVFSQATVHLAACAGGPEVFTCWKEAPFLALATGLPRFKESFEDDAAWGASRSPSTVPSVSSQGFEWRANDFDPTHLVPPFSPSPPPNEISTGAGAATTGMYGLFDPQHGYALGFVSQCDIENPPAHCFYHDGMTVARGPSAGPLHGAGGYFQTVVSGNIAIVVDGDWQNPIGGGQMTYGPQFFGVIDTGPTGFEEIQFREVDGRVTDTFIIFVDDFTLLAEPIVPNVPSLNAHGLAGLACLLGIVASLELRRRSPLRGGTS
jgi:hypothetical protein